MVRVCEKLAGTKYLVLSIAICVVAFTVIAFAVA